ncbi:heavy-metal-associated domain-containing protein [Streptomyces avicenniae]|uniref:heavy-metal-associated domain-containing protein n=1 Tax=Streptomyces avicenniae TaxID=500153 RepID=UPI0006999472|nr:heavy-metal-associated domain-containing protein [Streptomyces avicenniae]
MSTSTASVVATYTVTGMTCGHCVGSVSAEIGAIEGVSGVEVDLPTGAVTVTSAAPLVEADVAAAVTEAGYELTAAPKPELPQASGCCGSGGCH